MITQRSNSEHTILKQSHDHGHMPNPEKEVKLNLVAALKNKANASMDCPSQIIQRCIQDVPSSSSPHLPNNQAMRMIIQRARNKNLPKLPVSVKQIIIPEEYSKINVNRFY